MIINFFMLNQCLIKVRENGISHKIVNLFNHKKPCEIYRNTESQKYLPTKFFNYQLHEYF